MSSAAIHERKTSLLSSRKRKLAILVVLLVAAVSVLTFGSMAVFTDSQAVGANTFSTGNVDISTSPATALLTLAAMAPGDAVTAPITVSNPGSLDLRYAITSQTTENALAGAIELRIKTGVTTCTNGGFGTDGTLISGPGALGNTTAINVLGDPAQGAQAGDRALAPSGSEVLCFQALLPLTAGNSAASITSTATFTFQAEQTKNNP